MKAAVALPWCVVIVLSGCTTWNVLTLRPESLDDAESTGSNTRLVRDMVVPFGMFPIRVEAVGLVTGLKGTGSDPTPSPQRAALLDDMQKRGVKKPNGVLASPNTSLVVLQGVLRPGIQKGDHFDIELRIPARSETTSLRGGYLLETRLQEIKPLGGQFREGKLLGLAQGPVMVDPSAAGKEDRVLLGRGRILGGGVALKSRPVGLVLKPNRQSVFNSSRVANAVNRRFHTFRKGVKTGVAKARTDKYLELAIHPTYKDNIARYVQVVRSAALQESAAGQMQRLVDLRDRMLDS